MLRPEVIGSIRSCYMRLVPEGSEALGRTTHLAAYYERHAGRPSFVSTGPPPARRAGRRQVSE